MAMKYAIGFLAAFTSFCSTLPVSAQVTQKKAQHSHYLGRRLRDVEFERLPSRDDGRVTPNIDRIARDGMIFMDNYAHASCTAGRTAFILGQHLPTMHRFDEFFGILYQPECWRVPHTVRYSRDLSVHVGGVSSSSTHKFQAV